MNSSDIKKYFNIGYKLVDSNNNEINQDGIYFILNLNSEYKPHAEASKIAFKAYADAISKELPNLGDTMKNVLNNC